MNKEKKIILILMILVILTGLASFITLKFKIITENIKKKESNIFKESTEILIDKVKYKYYENAGKTLIDIEENQSFRDILKNYKYCNVFIGMPLEVSQIDTGLFEIKVKSPLKIHEKPNLDIEIGDKVVGAGWIASNYELGQIKTFQLIKKDNSLKMVEFKVVPVLSCF